MEEGGEDAGGAESELEDGDALDTDDDDIDALEDAEDWEHWYESII